MGNGKKKENDIHSLLLSTFYIGAFRKCLELVMSKLSVATVFELNLSSCILQESTSELVRAFVFHLQELLHR